METDKTTLNDLSIFQHEEEFSIFHKLNLPVPLAAEKNLKYIFNKSLSDLHP